MNGARILVVDDHHINLKLACDVLKAAGYDVDSAVDASTALHAIERRDPDLILMDINLPGVDGLSLTRRLKADPARRHIRIVALTALAMRGDKEKTLEAGCDGYIAKPIDTRRLAEQVADALGKPVSGRG